jgi:hypothetical protein
MFVFMEMQLVIGFCEEIAARRNRRVCRDNLWSKVIGAMGVSADSGVLRRQMCKHLGIGSRTVETPTSEIGSRNNVDVSEAAY